MTGYTDTIRKYAADERRAGILENADGTGEVGLNAAEKGRRLAVRFTLRLRKGLIEAIRFQVFGCGFTIAACAAAAELAEGRTLEEAVAIDASAVDAALDGLPDERSYCADLAVEALRAAVNSTRSGSAVLANVQPEAEVDHGPLVSVENPLYTLLVESDPPADLPPEDRHLFACLLTVAALEPYGLAEGLGLGEKELNELLETFFPSVESELIHPHVPPEPNPAPERNEEILSILLSHVPLRNGTPLPASAWLARAIAARALRPGHLWVSMGLFERPELTAAIRRHLPTLAAANHKGMRWKRYLFKQVCDANGGVMCKSPNCGVCSDYDLCFPPQDN